MKYKNYTLLEFIAAYEGEYFNIIEPENLKWAKSAISNWSESILKNPIHQGDCSLNPSSNGCTALTFRYRIR
jgi:hypothetical protein